MYYYEVLVATNTKLNIPLIYQSADRLKPYQIVVVFLRSKKVPALIWSPVAKKPLEIKKVLTIEEVSPFSLPTVLVKALKQYQQQSALHLTALAQLLLSNAPLKTKTVLKVSEQPAGLKKQPLTQTQRKIYQAICQETGSRPQLLLGINASGKTRIYAELVNKTLKMGRSALILVPEIGLSRQVLSLLEQEVKQAILHFHSRLTPLKRNQIWQAVAEAQEPLVIIGPRSSTFLPFKNLGLIILDEFHDDSFKQDTAPAYNLLPLSGQLAKAHRALLLCGSATPRVEDYYHFQKAQYPIHSLNQRALPSIKPTIKIFDRRTFQGSFHPQVLEIIAASLKQEHQVLIFHNRRGHWRLVVCQNCSQTLHCRRCQRLLVCHQDRFSLLCHVCGLKQKPLSLCPSCQEVFTYTLPGDKALVEELKKFLVKEGLDSPIHRFDSDNVSQESLFVQLERLKQETCLILGTQIISQGLDLPKLQTVIIVDAQQSLLFSDYRTQERYYQHVHQLGGRVGRGHLEKTQVVVQTADPKDAILAAALSQDWRKFYQREIKQRLKYKMPPFTHLAKISLRGAKPAKLQEEAQRHFQDLKKEFPKTEFYLTRPARIKERTWQCLIHVRAKKRQEILVLANKFKDLPANLYIDPLQLF